MSAALFTIVMHHPWLTIVVHCLFLLLLFLLCHQRTLLYIPNMISIVLPLFFIVLSWVLPLFRNHHTGCCTGRVLA